MRVRAVAVACALALAASGPAEAEVKFLDHRGKVIVLETPPQRLVTMIRSAPILYYAVDLTTEHMAAINADSLATLKDGVYAELIPEFLEINSSIAKDRFTPNVEAMLELNPDLVIQWTFDPEIIEPMERVGLKVVGWACCTEQERRDYLMMSGFISGRIDRAQTILKLQDESNDALRATFAELPTEGLVTMLEVDQLGDQIRVVANSSRDDSLSGVKNLAADDSGEWWRTIDAEQFLVWNPEVIIISAYADFGPEAVYANPLLAGVEAVKNRRVYRVPRSNRSPDAPEVYLTSAWLAALAHPDRHSGDFRAKVVDAYRVIYDKEITSAQLDSILEVEANGDSATYADLFR